MELKKIRCILKNTEETYTTIAKTTNLRRRESYYGVYYAVNC